MSISSSVKRARVVVLVSGSGSNLQAIIDASQNSNDRHGSRIPADIVAVIANRPDCYGLQRAQQAGIPTAAIDHTQFESREAFDTALAKTIDTYQPDLVVLAGFMRILTESFVQHYLGRLMNIHPSLLPKYPGLHTHQRAIDAGDTEAGVTVHFVTPELDGGPAIIQARVDIQPGDTAERLAARVLQEEHKIYPLAIRWFCEGQLMLEENQVRLNGQVLPSTGIAFDEAGATA